MIVVGGNTGGSGGVAAWLMGEWTVRLDRFRGNLIINSHALTGWHELYVDIGESMYGPAGSRFAE